MSATLPASTCCLNSVYDTSTRCGPLGSRNLADTRLTIRIARIPSTDIQCRGCTTFLPGVLRSGPLVEFGCCDMTLSLEIDTPQAMARMAPSILEDVESLISDGAETLHIRWW